MRSCFIQLQNVNIFKGLLICLTNHTSVHCTWPSQNLGSIHSALAREELSTARFAFFQFSPEAPSLRYRDSYGHSWWVYNQGSVPSGWHKEPTAKGKASLSSKPSFLFPVLKKKKKDWISSLHTKDFLSPLLRAAKLITPTDQTPKGQMESLTPPCFQKNRKRTQTSLFLSLPSSLPPSLSRSLCPTNNLSHHQR